MEFDERSFDRCVSAKEASREDEAVDRQAPQQQKRQEANEQVVGGKVATPTQRRKEKMQLGRLAR